MFRSVEETERKGYKFTPEKIKEICNEWKLTLRLDDFYLLEQLLGYDTAYEFYNLLCKDNSSEIYGDGKPYGRELLESSKEKLENAIHELMKWNGMFSRVALLEQYKEYYEKFPDLIHVGGTNVIVNEDKRKERFEQIAIEQKEFNRFLNEKYDDMCRDVLKSLLQKYENNEQQVLEYLEYTVIKLRKKILNNHQIFEHENDIGIDTSPIYKYIQGKVLKYSIYKEPKKET